LINLRILNYKEEKWKANLKMAGKSYLCSVYMNEEFFKNYFQPFLKLAVDDETLAIEVRKMRKKRGRKVVTPEIESPAVRALIKRYVDHYKRGMIKQGEKEEVV